MNRERHGNHLRGRAEASHDAGVAVLAEGADGLRRRRDLEGVVSRGQRGQHRGLGHRHVHVAELQNGMAAGQQPLRINIGHSAGRCDIHVATYEHDAHGGAGLGTMWGEQRATAMLETAGLGDVSVGRAATDPFNAIFLARRPS